LSPQLVAVGETVVDVPAALSARARLLDAGRKDKTDAHDARCAAIVALRHRNLRAVAAEDHAQVLRLLARRHHQLVAGRTRAVRRLHAVLCELVEGGVSKHLSAERAAAKLRTIRPADAIASERKRLAVEFLDEVRRHDRALTELHHRIVTAVHASGSSVTEVFGVGPIVACYLIGSSGDVRRFPTAGHYARYNATAPIEASSGPKVRHRLNPNGNRQLNHAIHIAARDRSPTTRPAASTTSANRPKGSPEKKRCAASNVASATRSTAR
jgi:transposase